MSFKSSSFNSDFGPEFSQPTVKSTLVNYTRFPKGPCVASEMTDLYIASKSDDAYLTFVNLMVKLQKHTQLYMSRIDKNDFYALKSALESVPEFNEIKLHLHTGKSPMKVVDFYIARMVISKTVYR